METNSSTLSKEKINNISAIRAYVDQFHVDRSVHLLAVTMTKPDVIFWIKYVSIGAIGLYENTKLCLIYILAYFIVFTIGILGSIVGFVNVTGGKEKLEASAALMVQVFGVVIFIQIMRRKRDVLILLSDLEKDEFSPNVSNRIDDSLVKRLIWFSCWTLLLSILFNIPTVYFLFQDDVANRKETLVLVFWYSCGVGNSSAGIFNIVCWKIDTKAELLMANGFQTIIMLWITLTHLLPFGLFSITVSNLVKHLESIKAELHEFNETAKGQLGILKENSRTINDKSKQSIRTDEFLIKSFLNVLKHQQLLQTRSLQMVKAWKGFVTCYSASCNLNSILILFVLRTELYESTTMVFKSFMCFLFLSFVAFIISYSSQVVSNLNELILQELSTVQWYDLSLKLRKMYLTTLILNQISVKVKIGEVVELNLDTYGRMVKTEYSILNMLLLKYGN